MARLKLAYGNKEDIEDSIESGAIPPGTLILTEDSNELYFYNLDNALCAYAEKYKFTSKAEAEAWVSKYNCRGDIMSVHEDDTCNIYLVDYDNNLVKFENNATSFTQVQSDWEESDTESPAYVKNKPDSMTFNYISEQDIIDLFS